MKWLYRKPSKKIANIESGIRKNTGYWGLLTLVLFALLWWDLALFSSSFIPTQVLLIPSILVSIVAIISFYILWRAVSPVWFILFMGFLTGITISLSAVIIPNHFIKIEEPLEAYPTIIRKWENKARRRACWNPKVEAEFEGITRTIKFGCDYKGKIDKYNSFKFTMAKGYWGYYVIVDKQLVR